MTDKDPIREHMARYTKMLLLPCFGATEKIKYRITPTAVMQYSRNPAQQATTFLEGLRVPMSVRTCRKQSDPQKYSNTVLHV